MSVFNYVAVINGGAQGIGKMISEKLLEEGARVVITDPSEEKAEEFKNEIDETFGPNYCKVLPCNTREGNQMKELFEAAKLWHGRLDIVCNYAGTVSDSPGGARDQLEVNTNLSVVGTYKAIEVMGKQNGGGGGVVINIGAMAGARSDKLAASYMAAETSILESFTRSFKLFPHIADKGVRVNCICPSSSENEVSSSNPWERRPSNQDFLRKRGLVNPKAILEEFMKCIENEDRDASIIVFNPPNEAIEL